MRKTMKKKPRRCIKCGKDVRIIITRGEIRQGYCAACGREALREDHG